MSSVQTAPFDGFLEIHNFVRLRVIALVWRLLPFVYPPNRTISTRTMPWEIRLRLTPFNATFCIHLSVRTWKMPRCLTSAPQLPIFVHSLRSARKFALYFFSSVFRSLAQSRLVSTTAIAASTPELYRYHPYSHRHIKHFHHRCVDPIVLTAIIINIHISALAPV